MYQLNLSECGILFEFLLPKKALYQGELYEMLVKGISIDKESLKEHFTNNSHEIRNFITDNYGLSNESDYVKYSNYLAEHKVLANIFVGYSIYEVDGVFNGDLKIYEERTQVLKIIYLPDYKHLLEKYHIEKLETKRHVLYFSEIFIKQYRGRKIRFLKDYEYEIKKANINIKFFNDLSLWIGSILLFTYGYITYKLSDFIYKISEDKLQPIEQEIWLTSIWGFHINKIKINQV